MRLGEHLDDRSNRECPGSVLNITRRSISGFVDTENIEGSDAFVALRDGLTTDSPQIESKFNYVKLRNWHLLWSSFYYEKKHFGYFFSFKKHLFSLVKDAIKIIFYIILFNKEKYLKHLYRFSGLISSMIGKKSNFKIY